MPTRKYYRTIISQSNKKRTKKQGKSHLWPKILGGILIFILLLGIGTFAYFAGQTPKLEDLGERIIGESTKIYDRTGTVLLYDAGEEKKTYVKLDEISPFLQKATLAAEDDDFYNHPGIDFKSTARALLYDLFHLGESTQGGSTITQQLVKNIAFLEVETTPEGETKVVGPAPRTITRKIKEAIMAIEIERKYSKDQILEAYLNEISYGSVFYGIEAASEGYLQKPASELTLTEAVTLASLPQAPSYYLKNEKEREARKNWILDRMVELNFITQEDAEKSKNEKIALNAVPQAKKAPYFTDEVENQLKELYDKNYNQMGLKVITTLDVELQSLAEESINQWAQKNESWYGATNAALVSIDPNNGQILAMAGGRNYKESQVNVWTPERGEGFQSPGSAFKPIVYATAFKKGYTPDTILWDAKTNFSLSGKPYSPDNYDMKQRGPIKMKEALAQSLNIPAVKTVYLAGINETASTAKSMGMIKSFDQTLDKTSPNLGMAIGGKSIVPLELVSAYGVFATEGTRYLPNYILKIENANGEVVYQPESHPVQALNAEICRQINSILSDNNLRAPMFGSRSKLYLNSWTAVKTGTAATENGKITDAWTIGYTKDLVTGVWVGNNNNKAMYGKADGSYVAAPIWNTFMKEAEKNTTPKAFTPPKQVKTGKPILDGVLPGSHSILWWVDKDNPRGDYPKNPFDDPMTKNWEAGVQSLLKSIETKNQKKTEQTKTDDTKQTPTTQTQDKDKNPPKADNSQTPTKPEPEPEPKPKAEPKPEPKPELEPETPPIEPTEPKTPTDEPETPTESTETTEP